MSMNISVELLQLLDYTNNLAKTNGFNRINIECLFYAIFQRGDILFTYFSEQGISETQILPDLIALINEVPKDTFVAEKYLEEIFEDYPEYSSLKEKEEYTMNIAYTGYTVNVVMDLNVYALIISAILDAQSYKEDANINYLESMFIVYKPSCFENLLLKYNLNYEEMCQWITERFTDEEETETEEQEKEASFIPKKLANSLTDLTAIQATKEVCRVGGREKEEEKVWDIFYRREKNNPVLVGELGVGKSAIIEKIAYEIAHNECPEEFRDYKVIELNLNTLFIGTVRESESETNFSTLSEWLSKATNVILVIDEMPTVMESSKMLTISIMLNYALNAFLNNGTCRMIVAASEVEHMLYFEMTNSMPKRFEQVEIEEPKISKVYPMIKTRIEELEEYYGVKISKQMVDFAILNSACIFFEENEPSRSLKAIEKSFITAKRAGKDRVDKKMILKNFNTNFELYENLTENDKKSTAYHEAGHFLVSYYSENIVDLEVIAVSIIPADNYMGVTVYDRRQKVSKGNKSYLIDMIASDLAGRVAEKMYTGEYSMGASSDLQKATWYAYYMINGVGMGETIGNNKCVYTSYCNEEMKAKIEMETQKIIDEAYARAEQILTEHKAELEKTVDLLLEKGIIGKKEIAEICGTDEKDDEND